MKLRKASMADISSLIELRLEYLQEETGNLSPEQERAFSTQLEGYLPIHLGNDFFAFFAEEEGKIVSAAFLITSERPASMAFPNGRVGTIMNVFTCPEFRRKGYARKVVSFAVEDAKGMGIAMVELSATSEGRPLYEKLGFAMPDYTYMRLYLRG